MNQIGALSFCSLSIIFSILVSLRSDDALSEPLLQAAQALQPRPPFEAEL
ncbi:hypothetical protein KL86PLE_90364 [uncultured Pleomorphomonas sp.]|uniref:Uncharacterized protein n=1 Tax=uncultured Pleomorphomonas sp. TaxID=442121 RepID=A0A212LPA6_9HYPH|nr:hypothetical protein KL86PLE_90364 [uncultured Pleomorphomonas sp.]